MCQDCALRTGYMLGSKAVTASIVEQTSVAAAVHAKLGPGPLASKLNLTE
jgi:hypothetical protein